MTYPSSLELVSFDLCPYVQRSVITLLEKNMDFKITYIDLVYPPAWFLEISPLGKVPVLRVENTVIFESAVINEYIDEISPPALHPADPLRRALNRAWIEFASELLVIQYQMMTSKDKASFDAKCIELANRLAQIEPILPNTGDYFNGNDFSLVDAAIAPLFMRLDIYEQHAPQCKFINTPNLTRWRDAILARPSVQQSVIHDFKDKLMAYLSLGNYYVAAQL